MMHRREFLATTAALAAAPRFAWGQAKRRVAIVVPTAPVSELYKGAGTDYGAYGLFIEGLEEHGLVEGQNLAIERYSAVGKRDLVPALAQAVVSSGPDVIFTRVGRTLVAIMDATDTIPVVAIINARFVERYVESLARPGGNLTGLTSSAGTGIQAKRLQLLHQAVPTITRVAWLVTQGAWESRNENPAYRAFFEFADQIGVSVIPWLFEYPGDVDTFRRLFASSAEVDGLIIQANSLSDELKLTVARLAIDAGLPSLTSGRTQWVEFGALMYFGANIPDLYGRIAGYADRILRGADPAEMPVEQPTKHDFIINLKTAREIGIEFPINIIYRATAVIE